MVARENRRADQAALLQDRFKQACAMFPTGVTVVTTDRDGLVYGITANAFSSVSLQPPQVLVCVARQSKLHDMVMRSRKFAVSILSAEQAALSDYFARPGREPAPSFVEAGAVCEVHDTGAPVLEGCSAYFDCALAQAYDGGDHSIFVGDVLASGADAERRPLLYFGRGYRRFEMP